LTINNTEDRTASKGDEDDLAGEEFKIRGIGQNAAIAAKNFSGYYLEKHIYIIAQSRRGGGKRRSWERGEPM